LKSPQEIPVKEEDKMSGSAPVTLWLRHETKEDEHRSALTPSACKTLIEHGIAP